MRCHATSRMRARTELFNLGGVVKDFHPVHVRVKHHLEGGREGGRGGGRRGGEGRKERGGEFSATIY